MKVSSTGTGFCLACTPARKAAVPGWDLSDLEPLGLCRKGFPTHWKSQGTVVDEVISTAGILCVLPGTCSHEEDDCQRAGITFPNRVLFRCMSSEGIDLLNLCPSHPFYPFNKVVTPFKTLGKVLQVNVFELKVTEKRVTFCW